MLVAFWATLATLILLVQGATGAPGDPVEVKINFQPDTFTPVPAGYIKDIGLPYDATRGFGWIREDSLGASPVPLDITPNSRARTQNADPRLNTLLHMQFPPSSTNPTAVKTRAAWEYVIENGTYAVTVAVGDPQSGTDPESHVINAEGVNVIQNFVPSGANGSATRHRIATAITTVSDGKLTIDGLLGTNTKIDYLEISNDLPPATPASLTATSSDGQVVLDWADNTETDVTGYRVYRSTSQPVSTTGTPLASPTSSAFTDSTGLTNGTIYYYAVVAVDAASKVSPAPATTREMPDVATPPGFSLPVQINFQSFAAPIPAGYTRDHGKNYSNAQGFGWVEPGTSTPRDLSVGGTTPGNGRDRNAAGVTDQRLDTIMHMQGNNIPSFNGTPLPGAWEIALPTGSYQVEVSVGDAVPGADATSHEINVEGVNAIDNYVVTSSTTGDARWKSATVTAPVSDGKLTVDAIGGTNTKINYLIISAADVTPPADPANLVATPSPAGIDLDWDDNTGDGDFAGFNVYRSDAADGIFTKLNPTLLAASQYSDGDAPAGQASFYRVTAVDAVGNESGFAAVSSTRPLPTDTTPPATPTGLAAAVNGRTVELDWSANTETDLDGYHVYRSDAADGTYTKLTTSAVDASDFDDDDAPPGQTSYYKVSAVDAVGNESELSSSISADLPDLDVKVNFQSPSAAIPTGYVRDFGEPYGARTLPGQGTGWTYGWVEPGTSTPRDLSVGGTTPGNGRDRGFSDSQSLAQRLDTLMHMQANHISGTFNGTPLPGSWEIDLPNGTYTVTVSAGDAAVSTSDPESHTINIEGVNAISAFVPTGVAGALTRFSSATRTVTLADGLLTLDATSGTNTKINYVDISSGTPPPDTIPPAAPTVTATAGDNQVSLSWTSNNELDFAGYNVYRGPSTPVDTSGTPLNGGSLLTATSYVDSTAVNGTTYHYVVQAVDSSGNEADSVPVSATPEPAQTSVDLKVNFQSAAAAVPTGYVRDFGEPYGPRTLANQGTGLTYGWVVPGTSTPRDLSVGGSTPGNGRDRNLVTDQRLDTLMHMQANHISGTFNGTALPGSWEIAVPNGAYQVAVAAGDPSVGSDPESHTINIEGNTTIANFVPSGAAGAATRSTSATKTVTVSDGRLTLDATGGTNTKIHYVDIASADIANRPSVTGVTPVNGATGVAVDSGVAATVNLPNVGQGVDPATLTSSTVKLTRLSDGVQIPANTNTSGGGDVIVLQPASPLSINTSYRFDVTDGVKDLSGAAFLPFSSTFTTGSSGGGGGGDISFEKVPLPNSTGKSFTSVTIGPDGKLYATTIDGEIRRYPLNPDGTTGTAEIINTVKAANGGNDRMLIGLAFDPSSTSDNLILWVSHTFFAFNNGPEWAGKISRLSGPNLGTYQDYVVNLPRSIRDHLTNSVSFGPDGALYVNQGSNTAMGAPDSAWGLRPERALSAALLRVDVDDIASPPLDVKTEDGGTYDPTATGAPVRVFGSGIRNAYDLVWHSNGQVYVPTNGSAAGGATPATPSPLPASCSNRVDKATNGDYTGPAVSGISNVSATQNDFLFRVVDGGYYGHPNPQRCEWVLNGGDPTAGTDPAQVSQYPDGTLPDRNWRGFAYDFANNKSPNGVIEYKSNAFGGALQGKLIITRYSQGDDLIVLTPGGPSNDIVAAEAGITGFTGFSDPLDVTENVATGYLYVTEFAANKITLLRPTGGGVTAPNVAPTPARHIFNDVSGGAASAEKTVTIQNTGNAALTISGLTLGGANASQFQITNQPSLPATVPAGASAQVQLVFNPTSTGPKGATLQIASNDPDTPNTTVTPARPRHSRDGRGPMSLRSSGSSTRGRSR